MSGPAGFIATMGLGNAIQYSVDRKLHGDPVNIFDAKDQEMLGVQFGIGLVGGVIGGPTSSSFVRGSLGRMGMDFGKQTMYQTTKEAARMFLDELASEVTVSSIKSSVATATSAALNKIYQAITNRTKKKTLDSSGGELYAN